MKIIDRFTGSFLGMAVGDALGAPIEMQKPGTFKPITGMRKSKWHGFAKVGNWTDDTSMALCMADSFIACGKNDLLDQSMRYLMWYRLGYLSSDGKCVGIGGTTRRALDQFEKTGVIKPPSQETAQGNGSLMRLGPLPLFYYRNFDDAYTQSALSSLTTHVHQNCIDACGLFGMLIAAAVQGRDKKDLLQNISEYAASDYIVSGEIRQIAMASYLKKDPSEISGAGHVVRTLEAALWAFFTTDSYKEGVLKAVNLGDDADTTGAVFGQLAGAYYGIEAIPELWLKQLQQRSLIQGMAERLYEASEEYEKSEEYDGKLRKLIEPIRGSK